MEDRYALFGWLTLNAGTWADWFSGSMSFAAVLTALGGYWWSERQSKNDRTHREREAGKHIGWILFRLQNLNDDIRRHVQAEYNGPEIKGLGAAQRWRRVQPIVNIRVDPNVQLDSGEIDLLMNANAYQFLMDFSLAISRYNSAVVSMNEYATRYQALWDLHPAPVSFENGRTTHTVDGEQWMRLLPYANALESLLDNLTNTIIENVEKCNILILQYNPTMKDYFGDDKFPKFSVPEKAKNNEPPE